MSENGTRNYTSGDLWKENEAFARTVVPSMLYVAMLMVIGVPGNSLVVYVHGLRFRTATQNFLIVCLAVCDLVTGVIAMPTEIADLRFHLTFSSDFACRLLRFVSLFCALTSNCILVVIAVDRYQRVCRPLHPQMTMRRARVGVGVSVTLSLLVSWPLFVVTGLRTTETHLAGLYGSDCSFSDRFRDTVYPTAIIGVLGTGFVIMMLILIVLYARLWRQARQHLLFLHSKRVKVKASFTGSLPGSPSSFNDVSFMTSRPSSERSGSVSGSKNDLSEVSLHPNTDPSQEDKELSMISLSPSFPHSTENEVSSSETSSTVTTEKYRCCCFFKKPTKWTLDKTTLVAFAVTVVFIVSFLPYLTIMAVRSVRKNLDHSLTGSAELNVYNIFVRSYFINSASNPIIYGVINARFRGECVRLCTAVMSCCCFWRRRGES
ncbi:hypothetical protein ACOMHN_057835 [Nucella lapillus]